MPTLKDKLFRVSLPSSSSGVGYMTYSPVGGTGSRRKTPKLISPEAEETPTGPDEAQPAKSPTRRTTSAKGIKSARSRTTRKKTLDDLLFSLQTPPTVEAFFLFDYAKFKWFRETEEEFDGPSRRWRLDLRGKPHLDDYLQPFRMRLKRKYKEGWFIYRWRLVFIHSLPTLSLHLLGEPGPGFTLEEVELHLRTAWLEITKSAEASLVTVQQAHQRSAQNFSAPSDPRLSQDLLRLLRNGYEFGRMNKASLPTKPPLRLQVTAEVLAQIKAQLAGHHLDHFGLDVNPDYLRQLEEANFGRAFLNETTAPLVRALAGLEPEDVGS